MQLIDFLMTAHGLISAILFPSYLFIYLYVFDQTSIRLCCLFTEHKRCNLLLKAFIYVATIVLRFIGREGSLCLRFK